MRYWKVIFNKSMWIVLRATHKHQETTVVASFDPRVVGCYDAYISTYEKSKEFTVKELTEEEAFLEVI